MTAAPRVIDWLSDQTLVDLLKRPEHSRDLFGHGQLLKTLIEQLAPATDTVQWYRPAGVWLDNRWVATGGFKGSPQRGCVEIGYRVHPTYRRRGLATALIEWLCQQAAAAQVRLILAVTEPDNDASQAVLRQAGFVHNGDFLSDQRQPLQRWQRPLLSPSRD